jgi:hypothetical protein
MVLVRGKLHRDIVMITAIQIDPNGIYDDTRLYGVLEVSASTLAKARRGGRLRYCRQGKRILYLGSWVLAWLEADARQEERRA